MAEKDPVPTRPGPRGGRLRSGGTNPGAGRPQGRLGLTKQLEKLLEESDASGKQKERIFVEALLVHAIKGNGVAIKQIWDRLEGTVAEKREISGPGGGPLEILGLGAISDDDLDARIAAAKGRKAP